VNGKFPSTPSTLLGRLRDAGDELYWQMSWKRFLELYYEPLTVTAYACYRYYRGGHDPSPEFVEDAVAAVIGDFFRKGRQRYNAQKGRLRTYLRVLTNARVVDALRKERLATQNEPEAVDTIAPPDEGRAECEAFHRALLATLVEDLRNQVPLRRFEIFERVKLKQQSPESVAEDLGIPRAAIDRSVHKTMTKLREIARRSEYREEFYP
jgi:RNA polymerase sigma factor (sigma-70 family)